jgi:dATP pyrophosphohydrolase
LRHNEGAGLRAFFIDSHFVVPAFAGTTYQPFIQNGVTNFKIPESVLVVIHTADLMVLLLERADRPGFWQSVTGSKDSIEEELSETARREVFEETGIEVAEGGKVPPANLRDWQLSNDYEIYPVWRHRYAPGVTRNLEHVFGLLVPPGIALRLAPREHVGHMWLPYREAADKCFSPSNAEAILQLPAYVESGRINT